MAETFNNTDKRKPMDIEDMEPESFLMLIGVRCACCNHTYWDGTHDESCQIARIAKYIKRREDLIIAEIRDIYP